MKKFEIPEIQVEKFEVADVIAVSFTMPDDMTDIG